MSSRTELARWLIGHTRSLLPPLGISAAARVAWQLLDVAIMVVASMAIVDLIDSGRVNLVTLLALLLGLALAKAFLRYLEQYAGHYVAFRALLSLRILLFDRLVPQAPAATQGRASGELTERATRDIDRIEVFFAHTPAPAVSAVVVPVAAVIWLAVSVDPALAAVVALTAALGAVIPVVAGRSTWRAAAEVARLRGEVSAHIGDDVGGIREVLGFGAQAQRLGGLDAEGAGLERAASRAGAIQGLRSGAVHTVQALGLIAVVAVGASTSSVIIALAVAISLWKPVRGIDAFTSGLDAAFAATERVRAVVEAPPLVSGPVSPRPLPAGGGVEFDDVTFGYPGSTATALRGLSTDIAEGSWTCIVGVSGSGKSTIASLILRAWDPDAGAVRLGGVDLRELSLDELRGAVALVPQRPVLLSGTIADNIRLAAPGAGEADVLAAVETAGLGPWLRTRPGGLSARVSAGGGELSGGELQRLALARALLTDPRILVLDEALSQLDADTAAGVRLNLARLDVTIIEITHRADLIGDDTPVIVMDGGILLESGTAGELRRRAGAFTRVESRN
ncbi:amino acid ABC transporter ATP-binding/permease protein [Corynebacterium pacaense]|uniref:amino acid ABC transporter ATP-binding/permease protein n=1 Tax=Corynebacterium pacaense TaxID=1816684 RepID=UPI0009B96474|nr:ABC transporter ATP-binding protein [Corynebacterium pacaense]